MAHNEGADSMVVNKLINEQQWTDAGSQGDESSSAAGELAPVQIVASCRPMETELSGFLRSAGVPY